MQIIATIIGWCVLTASACWVGWIALRRLKVRLHSWKRKRTAQKEASTDPTQNQMQEQLARRDDIILLLFLYILSSESEVEIPATVAAHLGDIAVRERARTALRDDHILGESLEEIDREALRDLARDHYVDHGGVQGPSQPVGDA